MVNSSIYLAGMAINQFSPGSCVQLFATPWTAACQSYLSVTSSQSLPKHMSFKSVALSNHLILLSPSPPTFSHSQHQGLSQ